MKVLILDNYDSFTYNLAQLAERICSEKVDVKRNNEITLAEIEPYDKIILSPGPGIPSQAGILLDVIKTYAAKKEILGVCLGQQAIAEAFGGSLINLPEPYHGVATEVRQTKEDTLLFKKVSTKFMAGRYHSWVVDEKTLPSTLEITAVDKDGEIMALRVKNLKVYGVQFHPESILTPEGETILKNFLLN